MKLTNTSRYPDAEVALLVEFAMADIDHSLLAVHVRNASRAYRGRAYDGIPSISSRARDADLERLVTIGIGAPSSFPCDNVHTRVRWVRVTQLTPTPGEVLRRRRDKQGRTLVERRTEVQHGYGGLRSPILTFDTWREALVSVAAHEGRHIWQYQAGQPRSEVDAEQAAGRRLAVFKASDQARSRGPARAPQLAMQLPLAL
jgi:hypothetical protein